MACYFLLSNTCLRIAAIGNIGASQEGSDTKHMWYQRVLDDQMIWSWDTHSITVMGFSGLSCRVCLIFSVQLNLDRPISASLTNSSVPSQADLIELSISDLHGFSISDMKKEKELEMRCSTSSYHMVALFLARRGTELLHVQGQWFLGEQ